MKAQMWVLLGAVLFIYLGTGVMTWLAIARKWKVSPKILWALVMGILVESGVAIYGLVKNIDLGVSAPQLIRQMSEKLPFVEPDASPDAVIIEHTNSRTR